MDDDKVTQLPVRFKAQAPSERSMLLPFEVVKTGCDHRYGVQYVIDESEAEVKCSGCQAKLNPMWVLARLANDDRRFLEAHARYTDEMKRLSERSKTKCRCCGKMTTISRS